MPFGPVDPDFDLVAIERQQLERWDRLGLQEKARQLRAGGPPWVFYEGPPTANGRPGLHHVWARVFKDLYPRFRTMQGYQVPRKGGWDCHGLPVELAMEKELGLSSKADIEEFGVAAFNQRCRESVLRYVDDWTDLTRRAGVWIDTEDAYWTLDNDYIESVWWLVGQLWDAGLLYEGHRVSPYCARCGTALSSHELGQPDVYRDVTDPSVFVRFPLDATDGPAAGADLCVWTTTPWTLVSNVAACVGPDITYVRVPASAMGTSGRDLVMAGALVPEDALAEVTATFPGSDLVGLTYQRPFDLVDLPDDHPGDAWRVVADGFVSTTEGSGIVHLAPAFGEDDARIARAEGLPVVNPVGPDGAFLEGVGPWAGEFVKDADAGIVSALDDQGLLVRHVPYDHSYPHCWRCSTPLIYWAKTSWFVRTSERRDLLVDANETVNWQPPFIKHGRFGQWLANNVDWALSRDRFWGTPLPIWRCSDCEQDTCISSVAELAERSGTDVAGLDLHRPFVDEVTVACGSCGGEARRLPPVLDAWFDSGAMPSAQHHFPFAGRPGDTSGGLPGSFPADFICEAIDQTRGWFYSLLAINALVFGQSPYRNVVCLALVVDEHGAKMSKSRGNVIDPFDLFDGQGADALRWYFFSQGQPWTTRRVFDEGIREATRQTLVTLWNVHSFFCTYADIAGFIPDGSAPAPTHVLDRWILSRLDELVGTVTAALEDFDALSGATALAAFVDDLSNWYVRRSRARFWRSEDTTAMHTLHHCLVTTATVLAPFCPFLADDLYATLTAPVATGDTPESVHLADWPGTGGHLDPGLDAEMAAARRLVGLGRSARTEAKVKVRQPLARALLLHDGPPLGAEVTAEVAGELNVRALEEIDTLSGLLRWQVLPNFRALGPRLGPGVNDIKQALAVADGTALKAELDATGTVEVAGVTLSAGEVEVRADRHEAFALVEDEGWAVALDLDLDDGLRAEGTAREVVRALNELRKASGFDIADRVEVRLGAPTALAGPIGTHREWIAGEVLATTLDVVAPDEVPDGAAVDIDGTSLVVHLRRTTT